MINYTATYTDLYELTMAQVYFQQGRGREPAVFDYFFRSLPFNGGYALFCGLETLLDVLEQLEFSEEDLTYLKREGLDPEFVDHLQSFSFSGSIYSSPEGDLIFPNRPVLQVEGTLLEAQIIETLLLNILNFQTLIATKASRMKLSAGEKKLADFGLRRAHGPGGYYASRAAFIGGFDSTSNVRAGRDFNIPITGTMAHSFIQSYDEELQAFRDFAKGRPDNCVLLVDTYDTLKSGLPNAITVAKEMENRGDRLKAIRLDSGDLAYLSKKCRKKLDAEGLDYVKIAASNQLDEILIKSLIDQGAPIDLFGVGTNLVTGDPDAALDGVYKLSMVGDKPRIKLSESIEKLTLPHKKQVYRIFTKGGTRQIDGAEAVTLRNEDSVDIMYHPYENHKQLDISSKEQSPRLSKVMEEGTRVYRKNSCSELQQFALHQLSGLPDEFKRFEYPHTYKVGLSRRLMEERDRLREEYSKPLQEQESSN